MKKKRIIVISVLIVAVVAAALIVGLIESDYASEWYKGELYFFNSAMTGIESENREIKYHYSQDLAENVVEALSKGPKDRRLTRIVERKTRLISLTGVETGDVVVNFSREFITGDNTKDLLAVYAVVKSLCALDCVSSVKVVIEGRDISTGDGSIIGYLTDRDINLPTDTYTSEMRDVMLYFPKKDGSLLAREARTIKVTDQQPIAQYIINELIKGPVSEDLTASLNSGTVLLSVDTSDNICFVNFKSSFLDKNSGSADKEKMVIYSIVDSLTEIDNIERVQFLMDGKKVNNFGNINIGSMFGRDESIIE
ncbi:MAG: GerMN domain-containing protein [Clostridia bacterium]|nr:GerMN domain-containing protein [Clostridia bacterium]